MIFAALSVIPRGARRLRVVFDRSLAVGAFSVACYAVAPVTAGAAIPSVQAALLVPNSPAVVELVLDTDLALDAAYTVACTAVPAADASTFTGTIATRTACPPPAPSPDVAASDVWARLVGVDLVHDGADFIEGPDGDLASETGPAMVRAALVRAALSDGLPWAPTFGGQPREFVDAPGVMLPALRGRIERQILSDDRVTEARVVPAAAPGGDAASSALQITARIVGGPVVAGSAPVRSQ